MQSVEKEITIPDSLDQTRLDQALATLLPEYSRNMLQKWIKSKQVTVNDAILRNRDMVHPGDKVVIKAKIDDAVTWQPQAIALSIVYEDDSILIINKPRNLVVHPAAGNPDGTLVNAILNHCPDNNALPRGGIVHRLDKDTSGLLVCAKTTLAHSSLIEQLQQRTMHREYEAIVQGHIISGATIDEPMGRHPKHRTKMAVVPNGKTAITHYRVIKRYQDFTHLRVQLETGRTHQIRVHLAHIRHPIVGDVPYRGQLRLPKQASEELCLFLRQCKQQMLHARKLELAHPETKKLLSFSCDLPEDMTNLLNILDK